MRQGRIDVRFAALSRRLAKLRLIWTPFSGLKLKEELARPRQLHDADPPYAQRLTGIVGKSEVNLAAGIRFKNSRQPDHKILCFRGHRAWLRRHISGHGSNRTRSASPTHRGRHLAEFASMRLR